MEFETYNCRIPAWALDYLVNAETEGLSADDLKAVRDWELSWDGIVTVSPSGEPYFTNCPAFGLPCDVEDCDVLVERRGFAGGACGV